MSGDDLEKCPKCGQWTFALNTQRRVMSCRRIECKFEQSVNVGKYLSDDNILPKLALSLKLNEKLSAETCVT
jgi:acetyl-CoA carboxylase beta subunit